MKMKRIAFLALGFVALGVTVYGQAAKVRVFPFEAKNRVSAGDAAAVTELFTAELIKTGKIQVENPANYHVRGTMTNFAGDLVIIVKMIDSNLQIAASEFSRIDNMGQVFNRLPSIAKSLVDQLSSTKNAIRQDYVVMINPFDLKGEMSAGDLDGIMEFIINRLVNSGIKVAWGNGNEKVNASLRGSVVSLAGQTVITVSIVDNSTNQPVSTATLQLGNIGEIYDSKNRSNTSDKWNSFTTALLNVPARAGSSPLIGKWRGSTRYTVGSRDKRYLYVDLDVRADGTIVVERYDIWNVYIRENIFGEDRYDREEFLTRTGTGSYSSEGIKTIVELVIPSFPYSRNTQVDYSKLKLEIRWDEDFSGFTIYYLPYRFYYYSKSGNFSENSTTWYEFRRR